MNYRLDFFDGRGMVRDRLAFSAANDGEALRISVGHIVRDRCSDRRCGYELWRDALRLTGSQIGWRPGKPSQWRFALGLVAVRKMRRLVRRSVLWFAQRAD